MSMVWPCAIRGYDYFIISVFACALIKRKISLDGLRNYLVKMIRLEVNKKIKLLFFTLFSNEIEFVRNLSFGKSRGSTYTFASRDIEFLILNTSILCN